MLYVIFLGVVFFFFKQKTAYEMRISDWSSACALPISHGGHELGERQAYEPLFRDRRGRSPRLGLAPLSCRKRLQGRIWPGHRQLSPRCTLEPWRDRRGHPAAWRRLRQPPERDPPAAERLSVRPLSLLNARAAIGRASGRRRG